VLVWDGEGAIGRWRAGRLGLTAECQAFRGTPGTRVVVCKPADREAKGLIERCHDYLERSFLPGRDFASPADFNAQLHQWLGVVNTPRRRALGCAPADRIGADRTAMLALPPVAPATGWRSSARLARDHYVRLDSNAYSVHPAVIGRRSANVGVREFAIVMRVARLGLRSVEVARLEMRDVDWRAGAGRWSWGQSDPGDAAAGGKRPCKAGTCQHCQMTRGPASGMERSTRGNRRLRPSMLGPARTWWISARSGAHPCVTGVNGH
jgi:hypothetical protein